MGTATKRRIRALERGEAVQRTGAGAGAPLTILMLHPSAELYGSDRTLLQLVQGLDPTRFRCVVVLPRRGPLAEHVELAGGRVEIAPLGAGAQASRSVAGAARLAFELPRAVRAVRRLARLHRADLVHTNTMVVLGGALAAATLDVPHLWHLHEIPTRPAWLLSAWPRLVARLSTSAVANSQATAAVFEAGARRLALRMRVIANGVAAVPAELVERRRAAAREALGIADDQRLVLLPGRINAWKGQGLLLEAAALLRERRPEARYVIAGDAPPGQERFVLELDACLAALGLQGVARRVPFQEDPTDLFAASDVVAVPSTLPEPFGLVAVEAMAHGRPVVAAGHGGLLEIVEQDRTGELFTPGDAGALAGALERLLGDERRMRAMGAAGRARQRERFAVERYVESFEALYGELVARHARGGSR